MEIITWVLVAGVLLFAALLFPLFRLPARFRELEGDIREDLRAARAESQDAARSLREELLNSSRATRETLETSLGVTGKNLSAQLDSMNSRIKELAEENRLQLDTIRETLDARVGKLQEGNEQRLDVARKENFESLKAVRQALEESLGKVAAEQEKQREKVAQQLVEFSDSNRNALDRIRGTFDERVRELQAGNEKKLDEMRKTVDEKLHDTLEKRLGESFKLVSDRLESVHKGLGDMQNLANGVGDLKRVLSNVKARGTWAEVQLGAILEQMLTNGQFERNVEVRPHSGKRVEFAIKLPGAKNDPENHMWLPIDSKFPQEDYLRLQEAVDMGDADAVKAAADSLGRAVRASAKDIHDKYIAPPQSTDFAILYLATEGLYAEILRQTDLVDSIQQQYRVVLAGPTTLAAIVSSLRMGFQTLAIENQASEVWRVLGAVKSEFGKFGDVLAKVKRQLDTASKTIDETSRRKRAMERALRSVEDASEAESAVVLGLPELPVRNAEGNGQ